MNENLCLPALPGEMHDALWVRVRTRKNRHAILVLAAWIVSQGLHLRSKKGFELVRGSDKDSPDGLKERADMRSLGLTADMLRGAINALVEVCFMDKDTGQALGWRLNFRKQARNPPSIYRVTEEFVGFWRKAVAEARARILDAAVAAKAVARQALSSVAATPHSGNPSSAFSSTPNSRFQNLAPCSGDLGKGRSPMGPQGAQEPPAQPSPVSELPSLKTEPKGATAEMTDFDRLMETMRAKVEAEGLSRQQAEPEGST